MQTQENVRELPLTNTQEALLRAAVCRSAVPIEEVATQSGDARTLIERGLLRLAVVVNPWGLDYELSPTIFGVEVSEQRAHSDGEAR